MGCIVKIMNIGSKEHYEMITDFEKSAKALPVALGRFDKEEKSEWSKGNIYEDGATNGLFKLFSAGYSNARCKYINQ